MNKYAFLATGSFLAALAVMCSVAAFVHTAYTEDLIQLATACAIVAMALFGLYSAETELELNREGN